MQTYRECTRVLPVDFTNGDFSCNDPLIFADLVLAVGDEQQGVLQKAGASRTVSFAGAHGQIGYGVQLCPTDDELPGNMSFRIYNALMVLPLAENSKVAPAVLPNIAASRAMLSVVPATQSDTERRLLWYRLDKLHWANPGPTSDSELCDLFDTSIDTRLEFISSASMAVFGRTWPSAEQFRVKSRARLTEREGLFLVRNIVVESGKQGIEAVLGLSSDVYLRFAVK